MLKSSVIQKLILLVVILLATTRLIHAKEELSNNNSKSNKAEFTAGEHFIILSPESIIGNNKLSHLIDNKSQSLTKPQIIIFFNYGCYGCWLINKELEAWQKANKTAINFLYLPAALNPVWESLAKLYYVNQELTPSSSYSNEQIFEQIHQEHKSLWLESEIVKFYSEKKLKSFDILALYNSFDVARKVAKAKAIANIYGITVTPNIILNWKNISYSINFTMVKDLNMLFRLIGYLINENPR